MAPNDLERDARDIIEFFVALAEQDAALVADCLRSAGIEPGAPIPPDVLLKLAAYCRLALWEDVGLTHGSKEELPSAHSVFEDALAQLEGQPPEFETVALCQRVHMFALQRLTWPQTSGAPTFILEDQTESSDLLDCVAEVLWRFRRLADFQTSPRPRLVAKADDDSTTTTARS
jgi:hypothetical protein